MEEIIARLPEYLKMLAEAIGAIAILATVVARLTPDPKDDGKVKKVTDKVFKVVGYLPTIGVNPRTKKMEEAMKDLQKK